MVYFTNQLDEVKICLGMIDSWQVKFLILSYKKQGCKSRASLCGWPWLVITNLRRKKLDSTK